MLPTSARATASSSLLLISDMPNDGIAVTMTSTDSPFEIRPILNSDVVGAGPLTGNAPPGKSSDHHIVGREDHNRAAVISGDGAHVAGANPTAALSDVAPTMGIPPPYLPLRKRASGGLRMRTSIAQPHKTSPPQQSVASMAKRLRPETIRWSGADLLSSPVPATLDSPTLAKPVTSPPRSRMTLRFSFASESAEEDGADTLSPLVRPTTSNSTSDHNISRPGVRASVTDPLPDRSLPAQITSTSSPRAASTSWRDAGPTSMRESILSTTLTNGSSAFNTSGSSVFTARSSRSTRDSSGLDWQRMSDDELSVDDCIDMYANGFKDEPADRPPIPGSEGVVHSPPLPTEALREEETLTRMSTLTSPHRAETDDGVPSLGLGVRGDSRATSRSSDTVSGGIGGESTATTNLRKAPKVPRDVYGFKHESQHVSGSRYASWNKDYSQYLARRKKKWTYLMNTSGLRSDGVPDVFPPRSTWVKRYIRKGIPPEWRGAAWFFYGGGQAWLEANQGLYEKLQLQARQGSLKESDREHIERDLNRTFPDNVHFKPDRLLIVSSLSTPAPQREPEMIKSLRRLLQAYAVHQPAVGYCQSLNFLAGHLLLFMQMSFASRNFEERAFALLCILTKKYLPGTHGMVLEGANVDIGVLMAILQETMPSLWAKLDDDGNFAASPVARKPSTRSSVTLKANTDRLPTVSLATTAWFMSCFVSTLPIESACRVWDCLWYEGSKTIFRTALAIFKLGEKQIKKATDPMEVFQIVQNLPRELLDANELMRVATMKTSRGFGPRLGAGTPGFGGLSQKTVESRREERRQHSNMVRREATATEMPREVPSSARRLYRRRRGRR